MPDTPNFTHYWAAAMVTGVAVMGLLWAEYRRSQGGKWLFKPVAAASFVYAALALGAHTHSYGQWVVVALILSLIGDILLIPAAVGGAFLAGLGAFLLGHLGFVIAFLVRGVDWTWTWVCGVFFSLVGVGVYRWLAPDVSRAMKAPVIAYIFVITMMIATSIGTAIHHTSGVIPVAATLFWLSDISVARGRFKDSGFTNRLWGIPFYFGAQIIFAYATFHQ